MRARLIDRLPCDRTHGGLGLAPRDDVDGGRARATVRLMPRPLTDEQFDAIGDALDDVPAELMALLDNVVFLVEAEPPADDPDLLGIYEGTPLTERGRLVGRRARCPTGSPSSAAR